MPKSLTFEWVLEPHGLEPRRTLHLDAAGNIVAIETATTPERDGYLALPGIANAHSHAFQYALRGIGERGQLGSFWRWREGMYQLANSLTPDELHAIATAAFAEMLEAGYTAVGEFHYLHHLPDGSRSPAMAEALHWAARDTGLRLALLPVYYRCGGFGRAAEPAQRRFVHDNPGDFARTLATCGPAAGVAAHSLRAVPADEITDVIAIADEMVGFECPLHIHVSEQPAEVRECVRHHGRPPVLLLDQSVGLGPRWQLVHATHAGLLERRRIAASGATVVLCPLTEGQLGDGWFAAGEFFAGGGHLAIGSDSNVRIDAFEEMRTLEFAQRAVRRERNVLSGPQGPGRTLWRELAQSGARALATRGGEIAPGRVADLVVIPGSRILDGVPPDAAVDVLLLGAGRGEPIDVYVAGSRRVSGGRVLAHIDRAPLRRVYERIWSS
ncbi:MAG TPA: formimidoylglutamate deiminase [Steroidobacteraceae bacterium]|nr:formimidoylglutamate deiminase [Steroidobacteraceae bacterium]